MVRSSAMSGRGPRNAPVSLVVGPAVGVLLTMLLCVASGWHLWQLWQYQSQQQMHLAQLQGALARVREQQQHNQAELVRRFDPQQIRPLLRERYGWVDPRELLITLKPASGH